MKTSSHSRFIFRAGLAGLLLSSSLLRAQQVSYTTPHTTIGNDPVSVTLGGTTFINQGLQGVGRISGSTLDSFGETFGSVSSMVITNWAGSGDSFTGTFNILPDRGYNTSNTGGFFSNYAARIQTVDFSFTPYTSNANIGGTTIASKIAAQNQISFGSTPTISGVKFTYFDSTANAWVPTSGLDPGSSGQATLFGGKVVPYVTNYTGPVTPGGANTTTTVNRLTLDSEALVLKNDGSGYIGDEYGANIYYFNSDKQIVSVITPPAALRPINSSGDLDFNSTSGTTTGRRNNQGFEGVALSPDGTKLFAMLQSATVQDTNGTNQQTRTNTRVLVYDVSGEATPDAPASEYVIQLPSYRTTGNGAAANATAAQSEIIALDDHRLLVLSRDANGQGASAANQTVTKTVLLVDFSIGNPTNIAGTASDAQGGTITSTPGVLSPSITPLSWAEAVNMLNTTQLTKFNINLDTGGAVDKLTLGEKWEGMSLVSANDPDAPNDYFLFLANDNDFLTSDGLMIGPDGTLQSYNAFANPQNVYPANRVVSENDTMFLAYRVTIVPEPSTTLLLAIGTTLAGILYYQRRRAAK